MAPRTVLRQLACTLWLCALASFARAQASAQSAGAAETPASATPAATQADPTGAPPAVLFLLPRGEESSQAELRDALLAQFSLVDATLVFLPEPEGDASLGARLAQAQALAKQHTAVAVFWIDSEADGRWLLHMMDAEDERVVVRQVDAAGERKPAAIEAVAVMTRSSTRALIEGAPENMPAPATASPPPSSPGTAPNVAAPPPDVFRLWVGYSGSAFAPQVTWQHGGELGASWLGLVPFYAGLSIVLAQVAGPPSGAPASFSVERLPLLAHLGYRYRLDRVAFDGQLGLLYDRWFRPTSVAQTFADQEVTPRGPSTHIVWAFAPRLRCELRIADYLGLYAGGGIDVLLNKYQYVSTGSQAAPLLVPNPVRPVAELGISFYP